MPSGRVLSLSVVVTAVQCCFGEFTHCNFLTGYLIAQLNLIKRDLLKESSVYHHVSAASEASPLIMICCVGELGLTCVLFPAAFLTHQSRGERLKMLTGKEGRVPSEAANLPQCGLNPSIPSSLCINLASRQVVVLFASIYSRFFKQVSFSP